MPSLELDKKTPKKIDNIILKSIERTICDVGYTKINNSGQKGRQDFTKNARRSLGYDCAFLLVFPTFCLILFIFFSKLVGY